MTLENIESALTLIEVLSVKATTEPDSYLFNVRMREPDGDEVVCDYMSRPSDLYGVNPELRAWLAANNGVAIQPYVPPTAEELRAGLPPLTRRRFRRALYKMGITAADVEAALVQIQDVDARELAIIDWEDAGEYERNHPILLQLAQTFNLSPELIDQRWKEAELE